MQMLNMIRRWVVPYHSATLKHVFSSADLVDGSPETAAACFSDESASFSLMPGYYLLSVTELPSSPVTLVARANDDREFYLFLHPASVSKRVIYLPEFKGKVQFYLYGPETTHKTPVSFRLMSFNKEFAHKLIRKKLSTKRLATENLDEREMFSAYNRLFVRGESDYQRWIKLTEPRKWSLPSAELIKFSILVPVYNSKAVWLHELYDSVLSQSYPHWQLILVDDASDNEETQGWLKNVEGSDSRLTILRCNKNGHICKSSNIALSAAEGDFLIFLDHDDFLSPYALNELATCIGVDPNLQFIYSDEDLVSETGQRVTPHFKPDWNPDLLFSHNYVTHLACYRRSLVEQVGGFREGYEGAQDYDLLLRVSEKISPRQIHHIPKVLYHWRMSEHSTARSAAAKSYATEAGLRALQEYHQRSGTAALVEHASQANFYRACWPIEPSQAYVSIIIPTRDHVDLLRTCIESIYRTAGTVRVQIIVIDNGSECDETLKYLSALTSWASDKAENNVKVIRDDGDFNFSRLMNTGAEHADADILLLLNNDTEAIAPGWLEEMLQHALRPDIGCVGSKLIYDDDTVQHAGVILGLGGYAAHSHRGFPKDHAGYFNRLQTVQNVSAVTAACLMVRKTVFAEVGGFTEDFVVAYNDVDFCLKVKKAGYRNLYTPYAELYHYESKSRGLEDTDEKKRRFDREKDLLRTLWSEIIDHDPAYNPNLTTSFENFSIRTES